MIEIHDDWFYVHLWYVQSARADYTVLAFRRAESASCEVTARFRYFKTEEERLAGLIDGTEGWYPVPVGAGAGPVYVMSLMETVVKNISLHPEFGVAGEVVVHEHNIHNGGAVLREILAGAPWVAGRA